MFRFFRVTIILLCLFLISCSQTAKPPEGNIDVGPDIYIIPIGDVDEKYLKPLVPKLEKRFTTNVYLAMDKRMPNPDYAYDVEKYAAMYILTEMTKLNFPGDSKILGVANVNLFIPESGSLFVLGQAIRGGRCAVISMLLMNPDSYVGGKPNDELLIQRMVKEAVHELGHTFRLDNVADPASVMYLPRDLKELDRKTDSFDSEIQNEYDLLKRAKKSP